MKPEVEEYIKDLYYDYNKVGSLSTSENLFKAIKDEGNKYNLTLQQVEDYMRSNELFTVFHKLPKKIKKYPKFVSKTVDDIWFSDMAHYPQFGKYNIANGKQYNFLLVCVDSFSRMTFVSKLETASAKDLVKGFQDIFAKSNRRCSVLIADRGGNYSSLIFKQYLDKMGIKLSLLSPPSKASFAEARIKALGDKLYKLFYLHQDRRWIDKIDGIVNTLNRTYHRGLHGYPYEVTKQNAQMYFYKQYLPNEKMSKKKIREENKLIPYQFDIGQKVRIQAYRSVFTKSFRETYTVEFFEVKKRYYRGIFPIFVIQDMLGSEIDGTFRQEELIKIEVRDDYMYKIESINGSKMMYNKETRKREKYVNVKWLVSVLIALNSISLLS